jgi:hypothetical protein
MPCLLSATTATPLPRSWSLRREQDADDSTIRARKKCYDCLYGSRKVSNAKSIDLRAISALEHGRKGLSDLCGQDVVVQDRPTLSRYPADQVNVCRRLLSQPDRPPRRLGPIQPASSDVHPKVPSAVNSYAATAVVNRDRSVILSKAPKKRIQNRLTKSLALLPSTPNMR